MHTARSLFVATLVLSMAAAGALAAEDYEYGKTEDLKGKTSYFVDTGVDIANRNEVVAKLTIEAKELRVASSREEADFYVDVTGNDKSDDGAQFVVYVAGKNGRPRLIQKFSYTHSKFPGLRPTTRFARDLAKLWRDAQRS